MAENLMVLVATGLVLALFGSPLYLQWRFVTRKEKNHTWW